MNFAEAQKLLNDGYVMRRNEWNKNIAVYKQVESMVGEEIIPKMTSTSPQLKQIFAERGDKFLNFVNQFAQLTFESFFTKIQSYTPTVEDLQSVDWEIYVNTKVREI